MTGSFRVNSIRNKFDSLVTIVKKNIDVFLISKTKIDSSFSAAQFNIEGYSKPDRLDKEIKGDGLFLYVREDIQFLLLNPDVSKRVFFVELNLRKRNGYYIVPKIPHKNQILNRLKEIGRKTDV